MGRRAEGHRHPAIRPQVEAVRSAPPKEEGAPVLPEKPAGEVPPVPDDVKELTEKFMEQKERNDRKEATPAQMAAYQAAEPAKAYCFPPVTMLAVSPHGNPALVITGVATGVAGVPASFSFLDFLGYNYHCWGLLIIFLLSILTGIGRKRGK